MVGAGPAGAFVARELARTGVRVLLIDRQWFPRPKVCGGCLNGRTLALLTDSGLGDEPASLGGEPLDRFELWTGGRAVRLSIPRGIAVSRSAFDAALVRAAITAGVEFLPGSRAVLGTVESKSRLVRLPHAKCEIEARVVIAADGLGGSFLGPSSETRSHSVPGSRIGAGAVVEDIHHSYAAGVIHMAVGRSGYVGLVKAEAGRLSVAAALDREAIEEGRGLGGAIADLLAEAGLPDVGDSSCHWRGTAALSRRAPRVSFERVFLIGDAAGYVEPFTGEGISWALEAAREVAPLAASGARDWHDSLERHWRRRYQRRIARRQHWCRGVAWALRQPLLVLSATRLLGTAPGLAKPLMTHLNAAPGEEAP
ncbi:MAG: NAD(P)-binding protein [bacterium]|nr:NAD(P)-binding protein [bacterium]